ncbi:MAG TPA: hypothetical protein VEC57_00180 [Candidatus Limnocylindrales bacterium]|nr:hypothetical protein [Candidatus Limnocylindrales bacterium]
MPRFTKATPLSWPEPVREERAACFVCGKNVATYVPAGGDGSVRLFRSHKRTGPAGVPFICAGTRQEDPNW